MGASITEVLMALGTWSLDLEWDRSLLEATNPRSRFLRLWWGEELIYGGVLLTRAPNEGEGITIGGRSLEWLLGNEDRGPLISFAEHIVGSNHRLNGDFELGDIDWRLGEGTAWVIRAQAGEPDEGSWAAAVWFDPVKDDVLGSTDSIEVTPGQTWRLTMRAKRVGGSIVGHLRLRAVLEGKFATPNMLTNGDLSFGPGDGWGTATDLAIVADAVNSYAGKPYVMKVGPSTRRQGVIDPTFNLGFDAWVVQAGSWTISATEYAVGTHSLTTTGGGPGAKYVNGDNDLSTIGVVDPIDVVAGERWALSGYIKAAAGTDGQGLLSFYVIDQSFPAFPSWIDLIRISPDGPAGTDWRYGSQEFEIPEGKVGLVPICEAFGHTAGDWYFSAIVATRMKGNTDFLPGVPFAVIPERSYRFSCQVRSDATVTEGTVKIGVVLTGPNRTGMIIESSEMSQTGESWKQLTYDFTPPSGYSTATPFVYSTDILGGSFWMGEFSVNDTDDSSLFWDTVTPELQVGYQTFNNDIIVPTGGERLHLDLVAENVAAGWVVDSTALIRTGMPVATIGSVVASVLADPASGLPILDYGDVFDASSSPAYDWQIRNLTNRAALAHLASSGLLVPQREWRTNPDGSVDFGEAEDLFVDRTDLIFSETDTTLLSEPTIEESAEERVEHVLVVGADRAPTGGTHRQITGAADNSADGGIDWFGRALRRSWLINDSTIDHPAYADAYARYQADRNAAPAQATTLALSDWRALGRFGVGDWVYAYRPDAGLVDPANQMDHQGRPVYPKRVRVLSRTWRLGAPGVFRAELVGAQGTGAIDITDAVRWEEETSAEVQVGDLLSEFAVDDQGPAAANQFLRYRASTPR